MIGKGEIMGKDYCEVFETSGIPTTTPEMRIFCQRPGRTDENGNIVYFTEQAHKDTCDINLIIKKYDKTGLISHISKIEAEFGNMTGLDFQESQNKILRAMAMFNALPSKIRNRFKNNPAKLLEFMDDANNREEAITLGLIRNDWTAETDGLGEHIKSDDEREIKPNPTQEI